MSSHIPKEKKKKERLTNLSIGEVSTVTDPANPDAHISFFKSNDMSEEALKGAFNELLEEAELEDKLREVMRPMWELGDMLHASFRSILQDDSVKDKRAAMKTAVTEFSNHIKSGLNSIKIGKNNELILKTDHAELVVTEMVMDDGVLTFRTWINDAIQEKDVSKTIQVPKNWNIVGKEGESLDELIAKVKKENDLSTGDGDNHINKKEATMPNEKTYDQNAVDKLVTEAVEKATAEKGELQVLAKLSDEAKLYFQSLPADRKTTFIAKTDSERQEEVDWHKKTDEVVKVDGKEFRKSEIGDVAFSALKQQDAQIQKAEAIAKEEKDKRLLEQFQKSADDEYKHLPGEVVAKGAMLQAIDALPKAVKETLTGILKAADSAIAKSTTVLGDGAVLDGSANDKLIQFSKAHAAKHNISEAEAMEKVLDTPEGSELYAESVGQKQA